MDISKEQIQLINSIFYRLKENHYKVKKIRKNQIKSKSTMALPYTPQKI